MGGLRQVSIAPHWQFPNDDKTSITTICAHEKRQSETFNASRFKVCKSVHHRTIQINHQPDATIFQFIILTFIYSSTCFGRFPAHHQELNDCSGSRWFYLRILVIVVIVIAVLPSYLGRAGRPDHEHSTIITTIRR